MASDLAVGARPRDLIPGDPEDLERLSGRLSTFGNGMVDAARRLGSIEAGEWKGQAGDAFRSLIGDHPRNFDNAGSAFSRAASALSRYAEVLREAQADAARATQLFEEAERQSQGWKQDWDRFDADTKTAAANGTPPPSGPRPTDVDPGATQRAQAQKLLEDARSQVHAQARTATSVLAEAEETAPDKPGLLDSILGGAGNLIGGFFKDGVWGTVTGIWDSFTALLDDPGKWIKDTWDNIYDHIAFWNWDTFSKTWIEFGKDLLAWDEWAKSPMRALGQVLFNVVSGVGVGKLVKRLLRRRKTGDHGDDHHDGGDEAEKHKREHEERVNELIRDSNKKFPLTKETAEKALRGPEGSTPEVKGPGGEGADVVFRKDGKVVLEREVKSIEGTAQGTFNKEISHAADQVNRRGEVFVQVPEGVDAARMVNRFRGARSAEALEKYKNVQITMVSPSGRELFRGPLAP